MKKNVGSLDTIIRLIVVVIIGILYVMDIITGPAAIILGIIAVILLVTGLVGFCPAYTIFGCNTCKKKPEETK
ncbi:MAG: DUF2892 domain-containing protein [Bacteroidales bacterium]